MNLYKHLSAIIILLHNFSSSLNPPFTELQIYIVSDKEQIESSTSSGVDYYTESASIFIIPVKYRAVTHRVIAATRTTCTRWLYLRAESKGLGLIVRIIK